MRWMWIDRIVSIEPGRRLVAIKNVSLAEEHLHDHFARDDSGEACPVMPTSLIVEGMAQAAGILVGHAGGFRENVILAKVSLAELTRDAFPGQTLRYTAEVRQMDASGAATSGVVELLDPSSPSAGFARIGTIDLMFSHVDKGMDLRGTGVVLPGRNFVFSEGFRTLLRTSGIPCDFPE